jgi:hypothetical protein
VGSISKLVLDRVHLLFYLAQPVVESFLHLAWIDFASLGDFGLLQNLRPLARSVASCGIDLEGLDLLFKAVDGLIDCELLLLLSRSQMADDPVFALFHLFVDFLH